MWFTLFRAPSFEREGREVASVHCERHSVSLREAPGHLASQAPAGKMRMHLGLDSGVCVYLCVLLCKAVCI